MSKFTDTGEKKFIGGRKFGCTCTFWGEQRHGWPGSGLEFETVNIFCVCVKVLSVTTTEGFLVESQFYIGSQSNVHWYYRRCFLEWRECAPTTAAVRECWGIHGRRSSKLGLTAHCPANSLSTLMKSVSLDVHDVLFFLLRMPISRSRKDEGLLCDFL